MRSSLGIVIAAYNAEATLARALESLKEQTVDSWHAVITDDGSLDNTYEVAQSFANEDARIEVFRQENQGMGSARNSAIAKLPTEIKWCTYLDADAFRKSIFENLGGFREDIYGEDWDFWLRYYLGDF